MVSREMLTRGDLPHWYVPGAAHFITYRLADTIPRVLLREWREQRDRMRRQTPPDGVSVQEHRMRLHKQFFADYDRYLDQQAGRRWLADPQVAAIVRENLYHHNGTKYQLLAYCIMPNHVHVLLQPLEKDPQRGACIGVVNDGNRSESFRVDGRWGPLSSLLEEQDSFLSDEVSDARSPLTAIMHSLKSYTANQANRILSRSGQFWQHESYDHWVRDLDELERIVEYIRWNPVRAGLCGSPHEWIFSSAFDRFQQDGSECALIAMLRDDWRK